MTLEGERGQPTQEDVARLAGVSRALVSLVMRGAPNVSPASREKVLAAAEQLGYRPNAFARSLASKQLRTLGVLINDVENPHFAAVYLALTLAAEQRGYSLLVGAGDRSAARESALVDTLLEHRVAGLALLSPSLPTQELRRLAANLPCVAVGSGMSLPGIDVVTSDELQAARAVIGHLVELGHRDIVHITGGRERSGRGRSAAYRTVMEEFGLPLREIPGEFSEAGGQRGGRAVAALDPPPTAVVAANDLVAVGAIGVLRALGLRVPQDISVIGYDDSQLARLALTRLTSVRQRTDEFGLAALALLDDRIAGRRAGIETRLVSTELIVRETTGPPPRRRPAAALS